MAIFEYKEGEHPGGFIGLRVVCSVGKDYRQKYYSFKKIKTRAEKSGLRKQAKVLHSVWYADAKKLRIERSFTNDHPNVKKVHSTGCTGLRCVIVSEKKQRAGEIRHYYAPAFMARNVNEKAFRISTFGYEKAWEMAIDHLTVGREAPKGFKAEILANIPDRSIFRKIRRDMMKRDHDIDLEILKKIGL